MAATCECVGTAAQHNAVFPQENSTIAAINGFSGSNYLNEAHTSLMDGRNM